MKNTEHHHDTDPVYNNPNRNRFDTQPAQRDDGFARVAYVLQGGGSLGAYQMGVIKGLLEAGYQPDWVAATSIGAIQAAIIVGNLPEHRIARLEEFWRRISTYSALDILGYSGASLDMYNNISSNVALTLGQKGFYRPRLHSPLLQAAGTPDKLSFYDTSPLKQTLLDLIDFDLLNSSTTRLSLGSVQISTGQLIYFNNINYLLGPEHVMASAALPPGFPAIKIDGDYYWDGGIHSNTPLEVILDAKPAADTLCFVIDCFGGTPFIPNDMDGVSERVKDIGYSTHAMRVIRHYVQKHHLQTKLHKLSKQLSPEQMALIDDVLMDEQPHHHTLAHITYSARIHRAASKDYNFGQVTIQKRIAVGYHDVKSMLAEKSKWDHPTEDRHCRLYEAPNNLTHLLKDDDQKEMGL